MELKRFLFAAGLLALIAGAAHAQQANVVTACGSTAPFGPLTAGGQSFPTVDIHGQLCLHTGTLFTALEERLNLLEARLKALEARK